MTELPPQDPWRGHAPPPPPPAPPYDPTMAFAPPPRRPSWWSRQTTALKVVLISSVAVLACCGGLMGIGIAAGPTPEPTKPLKTEASREVRVVAPTTTAEATVEASSTAPKPSPTTVAPTAAKPSPKPSPKPTARKTTAAAVYYKNCDAVRAAGKAPLLRGEPGYRTGLDRDLDGEACEPDGGNGDTGGGSTGGGGDNDPRFSTCAEAKSHGYGPYVQGEDPEYYWYIDRDNDGDVCE